MNSRLPAFYRQTLEQRQKLVLEETGLTQQKVEELSSSCLPLETADVMVENVIGTFAFPLAAAVNFQINSSDVIIPMVVEEPSVVAAVSNMAKLVRESGGFVADSDAAIMIGQIQLTNIPEHKVTQVLEDISENHDLLWTIADAEHPRLKQRGGGLRGINARPVTYRENGQPTVHMVIVEFELDCVDAMGANMINTIAERLAPELEKLTGQQVNLRILSNYATKRLSRARCRIPVEHLAVRSENAKQLGAKIALGIVDAYRFAHADPWRAATHNKGVMNGIDAVALATGNDWRAIEAGAHAYASRSGQYRSLTKWTLEHDDFGSPTHLVGFLELPMQVGTVGGSIGNHPQVQTCLEMLGHPRAQELASIIVSVGLAQNLGALKALATEGIQRGHMRMHARNVAVQAGATLEELPYVVDGLCLHQDYSTACAQRILAQIRSSSSAEKPKHAGK